MHRKKFQLLITSSFRLFTQTPKIPSINSHNHASYPAQTYQKIKNWRQKKNFIPYRKKIKEEHEPRQNERAFQSLVGVLLSVQARGAISGKVMSRLRSQGISIEKYAEIPEEELKEKIKDITLNSRKAHYISQCAKQIKNDFNGIVPNNIEDLTKLKGVGYKCGNVVLQSGFGIVKGIVVDVHVHRLSNRIGWVDTKNADETMRELMKIFPKEEYEDLSFSLIRLGQQLCRKSTQKCGECPIKEDCKFRREKMKKENSI